MENLRNKKQLLINAVIEQIKKDISINDLTAVDELLSFLPNKSLLQYLPEEQWEELQRPTYAISTSDGHNEEWEYINNKKLLYNRFKELKITESDIHLYKLNDNNEYEVIDSYWSEEEFM